MLGKNIAEAIQIADKHRREGRLKKAELICQKVLKSAPGNAVALYLMGLIAHQSGQNKAAVELIKRAISIRPQEPGFYHDLGSMLVYEGSPDEAISCYEAAIALNPTFPMTHYSLGVVLKDKGNILEAIEHYKTELDSNAGYLPAYNNMGLAFQSIGKADAAITWYKKALALNPEFIAAHQNLLLGMHYSAKCTGERILEESLKFSGKHTEPVSDHIRRDESRSKRKLKIGYVSPDLNTHPVANFIMPVLECHDHDQFEIFGYYNFHQDDGITNTLKQYCDYWRNIAGMTDLDAANLIRGDKIDILVDLSGHTLNNRLLTFALKPAPVQVTWLGYPGTTGISSMDYRITDSFTDPVGTTDHCYTEKLLRLPDCFSCYSTIMQTPDVGDLPAITNGHITFGSFNNLAKTTPEVLALWADILNLIPGSRLALKYKGLDVDSTQTMVLEQFRAHGIDDNRLTLLGRDSSKKHHLAHYNMIDIALDTFPYCGTTTTCDALWMGVPVITLAGSTHAARVGVSQLSNIGMNSLIASDKPGYVAIAKSLAGDIDRLKQMRSSLRKIMQASPLMDAARLTSHLESAYQDIWKHWYKSTHDHQGQS